MSKKNNQYRALLLIAISVSCLFPGPVFGLDLEKIKLDFLKGNYKEAIKEGEKMMSTLTGKSQAGIDELYYVLGLSYLKDGNYLRATDIFEIIINEQQGSAFRDKARLGLGDAYYLLGDCENASKNYKQLLDSEKSKELTPLVYYKLNQCALKSGDNAGAGEYMRRLHNEYPQSLETRINQQDIPRSEMYYSVQVGAFNRDSNAKILSNELSVKGYAPFTEDVLIKGKQTYRVKTGKFSSRQEAEQLASRLAKDGYPTKIVP